MAVVLITGCSSGIGKLSALEFARRGHRVYASMRNLQSESFLRKDADRERLAIEIIQLDVTDEKSVNIAVRSVTEREGRLDVLVNNAGVGSVGPIEDYTDDEIKGVFETNFFGAIRTSRAALPIMRAQRSGTIIMLSSVSGLRTFPFAAVYSASKFALEAISNGLRYELRPFGIRVVLIEPGNFKTRAGINMHRPARLRTGFEIGTSDPLYLERLRQIRTPGEPGDAQEVALAVVTAAESQDPEVRYVVGEDARQMLEKSPAELEASFDREPVERGK